MPEMARCFDSTGNLTAAAGEVAWPWFTKPLPEADARALYAEVEIRVAERRETGTTKPAAVEQQPRSIFSLEQRHGLAQLTPRRLVVARSAREEPEVQARHGKGRVQVGGDAVVIGAMTRHADVNRSAVVKRAIPALAAA